MKQVTCTASAISALEQHSCACAAVRPRRPQMKAIRIHQYGNADNLRLEDVPGLSISEDQILVRIHDAGVNPIDWKIREGYLKKVMPASFPLTIGQDFAGEVTEPGKAVKRFRIG